MKDANGPLRRRAVLSALAGAVLLGTPAAAQTVSSVQARQLADRTVEILYDLSGVPSGGAAVSLASSSDGGATFAPLPASSLSGAVGVGVLAGTARRAVWNAAATLPAGTFGTQFRVSVTATVPPAAAADLALPGGATLSLVRVPAGTFTMGSGAGERGASADEAPARTVTIAHDFYAGRTEVTQQQWLAVMGSDPSDPAHGSGATYPVNRVSWDDVAGPGGFLEKASAFAGGAPLRLPTEAEWEYAARGGTSSRFWFGAGDDCLDHCQPCASASTAAWYCGNADGSAHPVARKNANAFGLYDVHGNVWEWVADRYGAYTAGAVSDPAGPPAGALRVARGGGWGSELETTRSAFRFADGSGARFSVVGFRVARDAAAPTSGGGSSASFAIDLRAPLGYADLNAGRVRVTVFWQDTATGREGTAYALPQDGEFAFFYFFDAPNPEVFVKVLDFGGDTFKLFAASVTTFRYQAIFQNLATKQSVIFTKPQDSFDGFEDSVTLKKTSRAGGAGELARAPVPAAAAAQLTLLNGRVAVSVTYQSQYDASKGGSAFAIPKGSQYGYFYFDDPRNAEVIVKALDFGDKLPVFCTGLTTYRYTATFRNVANGDTWTCEKAAGPLSGGASALKP